MLGTKPQTEAELPVVLVIDDEMTIREHIAEFPGQMD